MWQAISNLLSEQHTGGAEIELRNELPGGEIHAAWHLRFGGKDYFVKCDERELLPILPRRQTSWSCSRAVKPSAFRRFCRRQRPGLQFSGDGIFAAATAGRA